MSIKNIEALILNKLTTEMMDVARELQYEQMINRITFDVRRLNKDIATIFKVDSSTMDNAAEVRRYKEQINKINKEVFSDTNIEAVLKQKGYQIAPSISAAIAAVDRQGDRSVISDYAVVENTNSTVKVAFIYSYKVRKRTTNTLNKAKNAGDNVLTALKTEAFNQLRSYFEKQKRAVPSSAKEGELFKLHGIIKEGARTTVALVNVLETLFSQKENKKYLQNNKFAEVVDKFTEAVTTRFGVNRERIETLGEFLDHFIIEIELGIRSDNSTVARGKAGYKAGVARITQADKGKIDKAIQRIANSLHKELGKGYKGSKPPPEVLKGKGTKVIVDGVLDRPRDAKGRFVKVTKAKINEKDRKYKEKGKGQKTLLKGSSKTTTSRSRGSKLKTTPRSGRPKTQESAIKLRALLDRLLPKVVASKMIEPRLVYRTGRFAQSVRTENVVIGPRGGIHIDYTYMKYPYQTFEPGFAQGSKYRDPRSIIKESIREIAVTLVGEKFMTIRRV